MMHKRDMTKSSLPKNRRAAAVLGQEVAPAPDYGGSRGWTMFDIFGIMKKIGKSEKNQRGES